MSIIIDNYWIVKWQSYTDIDDCNAILYLFVREKAFVVRGISTALNALWFTCERNQSRICNTNVGKSWLWWWQFVTKFVIALLSWCFTLLHLFMWVTEHSFGEANACYVNTVFGLCCAFIEQRCLRSDLFRTELFQFQLVWLSKVRLKVRVLLSQK